MDYKFFTNMVWTEVAKCPKQWRKGQKVFNVIESLFEVSKFVQFVDGIDCFYDDDKIQDFIDAAWKMVGPKDPDEEV